MCGDCFGNLNRKEISGKVQWCDVVSDDGKYLELVKCFFFGKILVKCLAVRA